MFNLDLFEDKENPFPVLPAVDFGLRDFVCIKDFKYSNLQAGIHFFTDDKNFENLWSRPRYWLHELQDHKFLVMPDFSIFYDMPFPLQVYNKYRSHWLAAYFSSHGFTVLPNVNLGTPDLFSITSLGFPLGSDLAFSSIGSLASLVERAVLWQQYCYIQEYMKPTRLFYFAPSITQVPHDDNVIAVVRGECIG